jgi:hypothetical protein
MLRLESGRLPKSFSLWFGLVPVVLGLLTALSRATPDRCLLLAKDELMLPTGFLNLRTATIPYKDLERVWRVYLPLTAVLRMATKGGRFQVVSVMLPDQASYLAVEEFLVTRAQENVQDRI